MHGLQVAYALLIQLVLERRDLAFMDDLLGFYRTIGLPGRLADIGEPEVGDVLLRAIAEPTLAAPHAANFERRLSVEELVAAMRSLEAMRRPA
jgi:glycerol dehydrogenase